MIFTPLTVARLPDKSPSDALNAGGWGDRSAGAPTITRNVDRARQNNHHASRNNFERISGVELWGIFITEAWCGTLGVGRRVRN